MREGLSALFVENIIHKWRTFRQNFQTQGNTIYIIICNWLLGKRRLSQMENSGHQQHSFSNEGLRRKTKEIEWKVVIAFLHSFTEMVLSDLFCKRVQIKLVNIYGKNNFCSCLETEVPWPKKSSRQHVWKTVGPICNPIIVTIQFCHWHITQDLTHFTSA